MAPACNASTEETEVRGPGDSVTQGKFQLQTKFKASLVNTVLCVEETEFYRKNGAHIRITVYQVSQSSPPW